MKADVQGANLCDFFPGLTICMETGNKLGWNSRVALLVSKYMLFYNPKVQCPVPYNSFFGRTLNQSNPVHTFTADFYNITLTPIIPFSLSTLSVSKRYPNKNSLTISCSPQSHGIHPFLTAIMIVDHPSQPRSFP